MKFNTKEWNWNNGSWFQSNNSNEIRISLFATKEAEKACGILFIGKLKVMDGITLNAKNYKEGELLLLAYAIENELVQN